MKARLVDCADYKAVYGILTVEGVDVETVQNMLWDIKGDLWQLEDFDWTLDDVFSNFPSDWEWSFEDGDNVLQI